MSPCRSTLVDRCPGSAGWNVLARSAFLPSLPSGGMSGHGFSLAKVMSYANDMPEVVAQEVKSDVGLATALRSSTLRLSRQLRRQRVDGADLTANQLGVLGALGKHDAM